MLVHMREQLVVCIECCKVPSHCRPGPRGNPMQVEASSDMQKTGAGRQRPSRSSAAAHVRDE